LAFKRIASYVIQITGVNVNKLVKILVSLTQNAAIYAKGYFSQVFKKIAQNIDMYVALTPDD
jgi:hypothetical protein